VWSKIAEQCDVVIDIASANGPQAPIFRFGLVEAISRDRPAGAKLTYIYCGGSWVHSRGPGGLDSWTSETQPYSGEVELTQWRWEIEKKILESQHVNGSVVRPAVLYGYDGSLFNSVFRDALMAGKNGTEFGTYYKEGTRFMLVHADDVADLFLRVAERGRTAKGQAFVACNPQSESFKDIMDAVVRVSGAKGVFFRDADPKNAYENAFQSTTNIKPVLGNSLLGWQPKKLGLVDGMDIYWASFVASLETRQ